MRNIGRDVIKGIIIVLVLLAGLASAYTPEQQTTIDGMNLGFQLGIAYDKALQGQNVAEFNAWLDVYNTWIRQHFGEDANLLMPKINNTTPLVSPETNNAASLDVTPVTPEKKARIYEFGGELAKFGKKQVKDMA